MSTESVTGTGGKGLAVGTLGLAGSVVIGLASTAPVYSLVATLGFVVLAVGCPGADRVHHRVHPDAVHRRRLPGAEPGDPGLRHHVHLGSKAFGPRVGWMGGWGVAVAGIVVLANLAQIGGIYFWLMLGQDELAESTLWSRRRASSSSP